MDYLVPPPLRILPFFLFSFPPPPRGGPWSSQFSLYSLLSFSLSFLFILQRQGKAINFFSLFFHFSLAFNSLFSVSFHFMHRTRKSSPDKSF